MKLLVDMNLPPALVAALAVHGIEEVHRSNAGAPTAGDGAILAWARRHGFVLITHDLDFSAILAASGDETPKGLRLMSA